MSRRSLAAPAAALLFVAALPAAAHAQVVVGPEAQRAPAVSKITVTPTYQLSLARLDLASLDATAFGADYEAYGIMLGVRITDRWWQPHVWYQRYDLGLDCPGVDPASDACGSNDGWVLSVGPGLPLVQQGPVHVFVLPQAGMDTRSGGGFTGGVGGHVSWVAGPLQPHVFTRWDHLRGRSMMTLGVGLSLELDLEDPAEDARGRR